MCLKVLSSEMDPVESRLIQKIFIKGSVAEAFYKNPPGQSGAHRSDCAFGLHHIRIYKCAMKKFGIIGQMWNEPFLIFIYRSSLEWMNAAGICKLRNDVDKTPQFILFSMSKGGTKTIAHLSIAEESSFWSLDRHIYDCKLRNERKRFNPSAQWIFSTTI
jgi:hypothetical protein